MTLNLCLIFVSLTIDQNNLFTHIIIFKQSKPKWFLNSIWVQDKRQFYIFWFILSPQLCSFGVDRWYSFVGRIQSQCWVPQPDGPPDASLPVCVGHYTCPRSRPELECPLTTGEDNTGVDHNSILIVSPPALLGQDFW